MSERVVAAATLRERLRRMRHAWRLRRSGLVDAAWYRARHPDVEAAGIDPVLDYLQRGGGDPGPRFDGTQYLAANRDVAAAGLNPLLHYLLDGWAQGRPLRPGSHEPPRLPRWAVLGAREHLAAMARHIWPRRRVLRPASGPDPAATIRIRPTSGAMPTGWCLVSAGEVTAALLVLTGGVTRRFDIPAGRPILARLPDVPAQLALQRAASNEARPTIILRELGFLAALMPRRWAATPQDVTSYSQWVRLYDTPTAEQSCDMAKRADRLLTGPCFAVVPSRVAPPLVHARMHAGLAAQIYRRWTMAVPDTRPTAEFLVYLDPDAELAPHALLLMAEAILAHPDVDILYADQDRLRDGRRDDPWFKPDFCPERGRRQDLFGAFAVVRGSRAKGMATIDASRIHHVAHVLAHLARPDGGAPVGEIVATEIEWPAVTAIVPTRDQAAMLSTCLEGLLDGTDYPALDIVVVDNGSREPPTEAALDRARRRGVAVLRRPGPFNFSAINNRAARAARGELLLFVNNDVSMAQPGWLKHMVRLAVRPDVGAVGAKLLFPDGTLQHGGVVLGMGGVAGHVHLGAGAEDPGYFGRLTMPQEVSAVTAACMLVPADHFAAVGGFDEADLPIAFNDVDLCLKLRRAGLRILWTPDAVLQHFESKSRCSDVSPARLEGFSAEIAIMQSRWGRELMADPFFSPNLSLESTQPAYAFPPRVPRPWDPAAVSAPSS